MFVLQPTIQGTVCVPFAELQKGSTPQVTTSLLIVVHQNNTFVVPEEDVSTCFPFVESLGCASVLECSGLWTVFSDEETTNRIRRDTNNNVVLRTSASLTINGDAVLPSLMVLHSDEDVTCGSWGEQRSKRWRCHG